MFPKIQLRSILVLSAFLASAAAQAPQYPEPNSGPSSPGLPTGAIAGIVVGVIVLFAIGVIIALVQCGVVTYAGVSVVRAYNNNGNNANDMESGPRTQMQPPPLFGGTAPHTGQHRNHQNQAMFAANNANAMAGQQAAAAAASSAAASGAGGGG